MNIRGSQTILGVLFFLFTGLVYHTADGKRCEMWDAQCEFRLLITYNLTMMDGNVAVYPHGGKLYRYNETTEDEPVPVERVITADGWEDSTHLVVVANGTMPGPPLEVWEGQELVVHVHNELLESGVTIHWHGLPQRGTPWMDGVAFVTQCPILPGQSFTYRFKAQATGTYWYHAHLGSQRTKGLFGALIVRKRKVRLEKEFIMSVQDWNHDWDQELIFAKIGYGMYVNRTKLRPTRSLDGATYSLYPFQSGLINGKGRFYNPKTGTHNGAPLEVFTVTPGCKYRFRVICASAIYPFRMSVDGHNLTLVASDGYDLEPVTAESFIINPGERYDFELVADQNVSNYWIRGQTMEVDVYHVAEAILRYERAPEVEPTTQRRQCTETAPCLVVNCPFSFYPADQHTVCLGVEDLWSLDDGEPAHSGYGRQLDEYFFNFGFGRSVNGRSLRLPTVSALTQPREVVQDCDRQECNKDKICRCTYSVSLKSNRTIQMVFLNFGRENSSAHPIHTHGYTFHVVKVGYARYDNITGKKIGENLDITCAGSSDPFCSNATWTDPSWRNGNVPGLVLDGAPRKDTITVPSGGYVVVRFRSGNPGLWIVHCHTDVHSESGMAFLINDSFPQQRSLAPPRGFPRCSSFP